MELFYKQTVNGFTPVSSVKDIRKSSITDVWRSPAYTFEDGLPVITGFFNQRFIGYINCFPFPELTVEILLGFQSKTMWVDFKLQSTLVISNTYYLELSLSRTFWPVPWTF